MAQTPFKDITSENILSAHVSGVQHAINKIELALNMKTFTKTNEPLQAVTDQQDATLHNFIYEGSVRNWLLSPIPVVKRNGVVVSADEYTLHAAQGAILFKQQQNATDVITADFTYVFESSQKLEDLNNRFSKFAKFATLHAPGTYMTNSPNGAAQLYTSLPTDAGSKTLDLFPFIVTQPTTFDNMGIPYGKTTGGTYTILSLYASDDNDRPSTLLAQTGKIANPAIDPAVGQFVFINSAIPEITLQPGVYWLGRYQDANIHYYGVEVNETYCLGNAFGDFANSSQFGGAKSYGFYGYRINTDYSTGMPNTLPTLGNGAADLRYLERNAIANPWIRRKA